MKRGSRLAILPILLSLGCNDDHPLGVNSTSPPAAIVDLGALVPADTPYESTIRLRWTAPQTDYGNPPATQYEVRVSTARLESDAWLTVDPVLALRALQPPGSEESAVVSGLQRGRVYYFVVRSASAALVWSAWSNVASLPTANAAPIAAFTVGPDSMFPSVPITVDASASTDLEDASKFLDVRWDWENDGIWDTDWSRDKTASHRYDVPAVYTVRLAVRDRVGSTTEITHRVARGPVLIRSASRLVGHLEEVEYCPTRDPASCNYYAVERKQTTDAYGPAQLAYGWTDQTSSVGVDTLRFDGGTRGGIGWPYHSNWVNFDVTIATCAPVDYHLAGHADCERVFLDFSSWLGVRFTLEPCETAPRDFAASGQLAPGTYRIHASMGGDGNTRLSFEMTFELAGGSPPVVTAPSSSVSSLQNTPINTVRSPWVRRENP